MSNSDELRLSFVEESSYGVHPGGTLQKARFTSEDFGQDTQHVTSAEIRDDRQVSGRFRTNVNAPGTINFELSYGSQDDWIAAALFAAAWSSAVDLSPGTTVSITAATGTIVDDGSGGCFTNAVVGQWIKISGTTNNNVIAKILTKPDNDTITVAGAQALTGEATVDATIEMGAQVVNGVASRSFVFEKEFTDLSSEFEILLGQVFDQMQISIAQDAVVTGQFTLLGKSAASANASGGSGYNDPNSNEVINATDRVLAIIVGTPAVNADNEFDAESLQFTLANNVRQRGVIGTLGPVSTGAGKCVVTGTLQAYYTSKTVMDYYLNWSDSAISVIIEDEDGNAYVIEFPRIKFTKGKRVAGGENTDIVADMEFGAHRHETEGVTARVVRFAA